MTPVDVFGLFMAAILVIYLAASALEGELLWPRDRKK